MLACTKLGSAAFETVQVLLDHKADPHITNKDGWTALHIACRTGHCDIVKLLLDNFPALADVHSNNGRYPLHIASKYCTVPFAFSICHYTCACMHLHT